MHHRTLSQLAIALSLCLGLLLFSPASHAISCPAGAPATCLTGQGDWTTTLQERSFDGGATIGGYFDTALDVTWLADANAAGSTMAWTAANSWANTLSVNGISGWRLPTMTDIGNDGCNFSNAGGTDCGYNVQTGTSEMARMFYVTLGDKAYCPSGDATCAGGPQSGWGLTNTGPFANLKGSAYWTDSAYAPIPSTYAWRFCNDCGLQDVGNQEGLYYAWAVHPGDVGVGPVPLPASAWLLLTGLAGMSLVGRRRQAFAH